MRFLFLIPIVLVAGYVIARNHHRLRDIGIGTMVGTSLPLLSDAGDDHTQGHPSHDRHDHHASGDSTHVEHGDHGH